MTIYEYQVWELQSDFWRDDNGWGDKVCGEQGLQAKLCEVGKQGWRVVATGINGENCHVIYLGRKQEVLEPVIREKP